MQDFSGYKDYREVKKGLSIRMEVWGDYALFTRPEMKVERVSYDVPTPGAARGMLEAVFFHPGMRWIVDRIYILNPIRFANIRRNEVKSKILASNIRSVMNSGSGESFLVTSQDIVQRASMMLRDVHYVIEAHFEMTPEANETDNSGKFQEMMKRRLRKGQAFKQPYLGCRECTAHFALWEKKEVPAIPETRDLGWMLYDMDYSKEDSITPMFFRAQMINGVVDVSNCEVVR